MSFVDQKPTVRNFSLVDKNQEITKKKYRAV